MPAPKFQDNIQIIDKSSQQFDTFLSQFKSRLDKAQKNHTKRQQNLQDSQSFEKGSPQQKDRIFSSNHSDHNQNTSKFNQRSSNEQNLQQERSDSQKLEGSRNHKLHLTPNKTSQEDNIKNHHPGQFIILKSASQLPSFLFEHIRKKNVGKLKNISFKQDQQRQSQIIESSQRQNQDQKEFSKAKIKTAQRYLNQSYVAKKQQSHFINPQSSRYQINDIHNYTPNHEQQYFRKVSSSFKMSHLHKSARFQQNLRKSSPKNNKILINDYQYSYCPDSEIEQKRRSFRSANHKPPVIIEQLNSKKMHSAKKSRSNNNYRIRLEEKAHNKIAFVSKTPAKRLPTVSEEQPLIQPKKFVIY